MNNKIIELIDKYKTLYIMSKVSYEGCSDDDLYYRQFCFGKISAYDDIIKDLEVILNKQLDKQ